MSTGVAVAGDGDQRRHRHAHVGGVLVAELQGCAEPLVVLVLDQSLVARLVEDVGDLLGGERRRHLVLGLDAEQADQRLGQPVHDVDDRRDDLGHHDERRHEEDGGALGPGDRDVLGDHLAVDDVEEHDDREREHERHGIRHDLGQPERLDDGHQGVVQRRLGHGTEEHGAHGDAELAGGQQDAGALERVERHRGRPCCPARRAARAGCGGPTSRRTRRRRRRRWRRGGAP